MKCGVSAGLVHLCTCAFPSVCMAKSCDTWELCHSDKLLDWKSESSCQSSSVLSTHQKDDATKGPCHSDILTHVKNVAAVPFWAETRNQLSLCISSKQCCSWRLMFEIHALHCHRHWFCHWRPMSVDRIVCLFVCTIKREWPKWQHVWHERNGATVTCWIKNQIDDEWQCMGQGSGLWAKCIAHQNLCRKWVFSTTTLNFGAPLVHSSRHDDRTSKWRLLWFSMTQNAIESKLKQHRSPVASLIEQKQFCWHLSQMHLARETMPVRFSTQFASFFKESLCSSTSFSFRP